VCRIGATVELFEGSCLQGKEISMESSFNKSAIKNILFATDFSPASELVLPYARALARAYDATLVTVHVVAPMVVAVEPPGVVNMAELARRDMLDLAATGELETIKHREIVAEGPIWDSLAQIVEKAEIDLIVVGTHGRTGLKKLVLGSVAEEIFREAPCPVLTVGPQVTSELRHTPQIKTVLYATDFSADCPGALQQALALATQQNAKLLLLTVVEHTTMPDSERVIDALHERLKAMIPPGTVAFETLVEFGHPAMKILDVAEQFTASVVVLGAHRPAHFANRFMDIAYRVICEAPCPVLTCNALVQPFFNEKAFAAAAR
jgi:nucleotide-binding universal stress UspA family protein